MRAWFFLHGWSGTLWSGAMTRYAPTIGREGKKGMGEQRESNARWLPAFISICTCLMCVCRCVCLYPLAYFVISCRSLVKYVRNCHVNILPSVRNIDRRVVVYIPPRCARVKCFAVWRPGVCCSVGVVDGKGLATSLPNPCPLLFIIVRRNSRWCPTSSCLVFNCERVFHRCWRHETTYRMNITSTSWGRCWKPCRMGSPSAAR